MKLSDLKFPAPIRDYDLDSLAQLEPEEPFKPFVMVKSQSGDIPIWLDYCFDTIIATQKFYNNDANKQRNDDFTRRMNDWLNWGKPLPNQTLQDWEKLEIRQLPPLIRRANLVGLYELITLYGVGAFPKENGGEVFFIRVMRGKHPLIGVWADSYAAAKSSLLKADKWMAQQCSNLRIKHCPIELPQ